MWSALGSTPPSLRYPPVHLYAGRSCTRWVKIGAHSFGYCDHSITRFNIPTSLRRINHYAFSRSLRTPIRLHDGIERIGAYAFSDCVFANFRVPSLITVIPINMLRNCKSMFSVGIPEDVTEIKSSAFYDCQCLRNVAFSPNAVIDDNIFGEGSVIERSDLWLLFGSEAEILRELQHRFDRLPIHKLVYYQSYHQGVLHNLIATINMRSGQDHAARSKLDPTGNQQDCLGMTPLLILACSSDHNIEVYRVVIENYPTNLITKDRWGATPLLYAFWGAAPNEVIQFLLNSYRLHTGYEFNWTMMIETMGRCDTPKEIIDSLLRVKQMHFPDQPIDWDYLLGKFAQPSNLSVLSRFQERMRYLLMCGMSMHVEALAFKLWRDYITSMIQTSYFKYGGDNCRFLHRIQDKTVSFEDELSRLKEVTTILELALWKMKIIDHSLKENVTRLQKKINTDESSIRQQCRVACGADVVIGCVLLFLINTGEEAGKEEASDSSDEDY